MIQIELWSIEVMKSLITLVFLAVVIYGGFGMNFANAACPTGHYQCAPNVCCPN